MKTLVPAHTLAILQAKPLPLKQPSTLINPAYFVLADTVQRRGYGYVPFAQQALERFDELILRPQGRPLSAQHAAESIVEILNPHQLSMRKLDWTRTINEDAAIARSLAYAVDEAILGISYDTLLEGAACYACILTDNAMISRLSAYVFEHQQLFRNASSTMKTTQGPQVIEANPQNGYQRPTIDNSIAKNMLNTGDDQLIEMDYLPTGEVEITQTSPTGETERISPDTYAQILAANDDDWGLLNLVETLIDSEFIGKLVESQPLAAYEQSRTAISIINTLAKKKSSRAIDAAKGLLTGKYLLIGRNESDQYRTLTPRDIEVPCFCTRIFRKAASAEMKAAAIRESLNQLHLLEESGSSFRLPKEAESKGPSSKQEIFKNVFYALSECRDGYSSLRVFMHQPNLSAADLTQIDNQFIFSDRDLKRVNDHVFKRLGDFSEEKLERLISFILLKNVPKALQQRLLLTILNSPIISASVRNHCIAVALSSWVSKRTHRDLVLACLDNPDLLVATYILVSDHEYFYERENFLAQLKELRSQTVNSLSRWLQSKMNARYFHLTLTAIIIERGLTELLILFRAAAKDALSKTPTSTGLVRSYETLSDEVSRLQGDITANLLSEGGPSLKTLINLGNISGKLWNPAG